MDLGDFLSPDAEIGKQLESLVKLIELIFEHARKIIMENTSKMAAGDKNPSLLVNVNRIHKKYEHYRVALLNLREFDK